MSQTRPNLRCGGCGGYLASDEALAWSESFAVKALRLHPLELKSAEGEGLFVKDVRTRTCPVCPVCLTDLLNGASLESLSAPRRYRAMALTAILALGLAALAPKALPAVMSALWLTDDPVPHGAVIHQP